MATADVGGLIFSGGTLSANPSSLSGTPPFGTSLGNVKNIVVKSGRKTTMIREEPFGPMPLTGIDLGEAWVMAGSFRGTDKDAFAKAFANVTGGASGGVLYPNGNSFRTGGLLSNRGFRLLLTPDDYENQWFFYGWNAVMLTEEDGSFPFQRSEELIIPFKVIFLPDASNRTVAWLPKSELESILT